MMPGMPERRSHDYARHGITSLFAAFNIADGTVITALHPQHRAVEFKKFLIAIDKAVPADLEVHPDAATTSPPTKPRRSTNGWPSTPVSTCTSPRPVRRGSTRRQTPVRVCSPTNYCAAACTKGVAVVIAEKTTVSAAGWLGGSVW